MIKVIILSGGHIRRIHSSSSAQNIYNEINNDIMKNIEVRKIDIDENNNWSNLGLPTNIHRVFGHGDILIDTTHSDNTAINLAKRMGLKNIIEKEWHQGYIRYALRQMGINTPDFKIVNRTDRNDGGHFEKLKEYIHKKMNLPIMVKSAHKRLPTFVDYNHDDIIDYIKDIHIKDDSIIEEYVRGKKYTIIAIKDFRGERIYLSIIYEILAENKVKRLVEANYLSEKDKAQMRNIAREVCDTFGFNIMRIDFVLNNFGLKVVNVSLNPQYTNGSVLYEIFQRLGINWLEIVNSRTIN